MNLRPSMLDDLGLLATLSWFCREYQKVYPHIRVETQFQIEEAEIPVKLRTMIFRILQEAFNNIAKHSQADHVWLGINRRMSVLEIDVRDNGQGMDSEILINEGKVARGFGISSMRERTRACGGSIRIQTHPGTGTRLKLTLPAEPSSGMSDTHDQC
jgi:signal transduction histidine kinase